MEKFLIIDFGQLVLKDTFAFLSSSLDKLVKTLKAKGGNMKDNFKNLYRYFKTQYHYLPEEDFNLLLQKGVFPYEYMTSFETLHEQSLPPKECFYSGLTKKNITPDEYTFAKKVFSTFHCQNLLDYQNLYMTTDTLLLADVFENFRSLSHRLYGLDPSHFYSAPGLTWDAALKVTDIELELITDIDMALFIDECILGGYAAAHQQFAQANNPYLGEAWNPFLPMSWLMGFDCNNMYGAKMKEPLAYGGFKWVEDLQCLTSDLFKNFKADSKVGYFVECDLGVPIEKHDQWSDLPYAMENRIVTGDDLSDYQKKMCERLELSFGGKKMITSLFPKKNYYCHHSNLQQYLNAGLELQKIHRAVSCKQKPWLRPHVDKNTKLRMTAATEVEKDIAKLMVNATFGKACENVHNYSNVDLCMSGEQLTKKVSRPEFKRAFGYGENLVAVESLRKTVTLNKPRYVGANILALAKVELYSFHEFIKDQYPNSKLLFTDTDSLCYHIFHDGDIYDELKNNDLIDFSNYDPKHPNYTKRNRLVPGKWKDDFAGIPLEVVIALRAKMYAIKRAGLQDKMRAKGVPGSCMQDISFEDYKKVFEDQDVTHITMTQIRQQYHQLYTVEASKLAFSPLNDKRYQPSMREDSLPFGHYKLEIEKETLNMLNAHTDCSCCLDILDLLSS